MTARPGGRPCRACGLAHPSAMTPRTDVIGIGRSSGPKMLIGVGKRTLSPMLGVSLAARTHYVKKLLAQAPTCHVMGAIAPTA